MNDTPTVRSTLPVSMESEPGMCIHQIFERQACMTPGVTAVCCGDQQFSYAELNQRANQLAHRLIAEGIKAEVPVALCLNRSLDMIVAILGVLKAGGAYLPIDLAYPKERLRFMLEDTQAPVLITEQNLISSLPEHSARVICIDSEWGSIAAQPAENPAARISPQNAAYIIFTSGSTGKPKGVLVTHHNVVRLFQETEPWYHFDARDVWTLFHSYAFDFSVWEIWGALFYGGRLVVVPYMVSRWPEAFHELLIKEQVTVLNQTPSAFRQLIRADAESHSERSLALRYVIFGGEALELQSLRPWFERHGDRKPLLVNMYGITETTVHVTYRPIQLEDLSSGACSPIGVPIPDLQIHLLDPEGSPVPVGCPGEIYVGGGGVARGYLNRPELNQQRFIPDRFSGKPGARLYRTGDLAQRTESGELEYLGRADQQIKIRGFRIEIGEIEAAINGHVDVSESVVVALDSPTGDKRLAAYVVSKSGTLHQSELREYLKTKIPEYMVPASFLFLDSLPLTPNGKVDRRALPAPDKNRPALTNPFVPPRNPTEQTLTEIWQEVLDLDAVGVEDNLFELGGDSIRSLGILAKAKQRGLDITLQQLFQHPTVAGLASCALSDRQKTTAVQTAAFGLVSAEDRAKMPADVEDAYPMIKLQTGMFYYNELNPASAVYHDVFSFHIETPFAQDKLKVAFERLVARHPVLRTSFHIGEFSEPMQLVHRSVQVPFTLEDLRSCAPSEQHQRLVEWVECEKRRPFERTVPPLLRFHVQHQSDSCFQLIVSFHHVYLDGWSLALLVTEVLQDYSALLGGRDDQVPSPQNLYRDFVALERQDAQSEACRQFWTEVTRDSQPALLPRWPKSMRTGGHEQMRGPELPVEAGVFAGLKQLAQSAGVPLKTVLLAAHQRVMSYLYGQQDVMSGLVCNGRPEDIDGEKIIGLFLNTLPVRLQMAGGTWLELVKNTFAAEQAIIPHRRVPLADIQAWNNGQQLFEAAFDFVHFHVYKNVKGYNDGGFMEGHYFEANNLTTLTTFMLDVTSTHLQMHIDYDPNLLCAQQVAQMSQYYIAVLDAMSRNPQGRYESFCPLSADEKEQIVSTWNDTQRAYPGDKSVHQLFEEQVQKNPAAPAVRFEDKCLSYSELNRKADDIAQRLIVRQASPRSLVGVYVERSPMMVAALLGVLKAGCAYVPLDPAYPRERLERMLSDAQCSVVLTEKKLRDCLPATSANILEIDSPTRPGESMEAEPPQDLSSENLAYVIYTSGSTGQPKGVQISHRSVVNVLGSLADQIQFTPQDHLLAVTTISFDIAGLEIFMPLICGGQLTLVSREQAADGLQLCSKLASSGATVMQATPATWRLLIEAGWAGDKKLKALCGGEALSRELAAALLQHAGEVWNVYGPTETTIWSLAWKVLPNHEILIGRPVANTQGYILNSNLQPVPIGTPGELYLGGDGLARGYLNRPELTQERFVPHPFAVGTESRVYKTGDLARYWPDGNIECLGRLDHQVKIRGFRIELGDIESALRQHAGIREAVVVALDEEQEKRLAAYYVAEAGNELSGLELREFLHSKLPEYMVPSIFVRLEKFPLTPSGKIDRKSLPKPDRSRREWRKAYVAPGTPLEMDLTGIWEDVFRMEKIGLDDNFFDLGGHSLTAIQIIVRIREKVGVELPLARLFETPTPGGLAIAVLNQMLASADSDGNRIVDEISQMSDEQAKELLARQKTKEE